ALLALSGQYSPVGRSDCLGDLRPAALSDRQSLFDLDPTPICQAIDNVFRAVPIEVVFRPRAADDYFASATFIVDGIIYRFFEFSLEGVRGASSDEDVIIRNP
ncbi:MAG TPA: hypothetical protein VIZ87_07205, partial [Terrimicrobium sp.]